MSSFTLDGKTAKELGVIMLRTSQRPILSGTRDYIEAIPLMPGAHDFGADLDPRLFHLECAFVADTPAELQERASALAAFLVDVNGRPRTMPLTFTLQPERHFNVRYAGQMPIDRVVGLGRFTLPLVAYDPFAYAEDTAYDEPPGEYDTGLLYDTGLMYENPESFSWQYASHMSGVYNYSKLTTPLIVTIAGNAGNPSVTNVTTGETLSLATTISGQTLVIDGKKMTVTIDGANAMQYVSGEFINLVSGDNGLVFETSGASPSATVTYGWMHKFV